MANSGIIIIRRFRVGAGRSRVFIKLGFNIEDFLPFFFFGDLAFSLGVSTIKLEALSFNRLFSA
jgi:hypothetical protein